MRRLRWILRVLEEWRVIDHYAYTGDATGLVRWLRRLVWNPPAPREPEHYVAPGFCRWPVGFYG